MSTDSISCSCLSVGLDVFGASSEEGCLVEFSPEEGCLVESSPEERCLVEFSPEERCSVELSPLSVTVASIPLSAVPL